MYKAENETSHPSPRPCPSLLHGHERVTSLSYENEIIYVYYYLIFHIKKNMLEVLPHIALLYLNFLVFLCLDVP